MFRRRGGLPKSGAPYGVLMAAASPGSLGSRLLWFVAIWAGSVAVVAGGARLLQWLVFTP